MALVVKNLPANAGDVLETRAPYSGWEETLEDGMAVHSSILGQISCMVTKYQMLHVFPALD